ncbi:MAG: hypothetical protein HY247_07715 [archaeon]|nr:MAG: hypothetical protein HY247_07715 [archaeon]
MKYNLVAAAVVIVLVAGAVAAYYWEAWIPGRGPTTSTQGEKQFYIEVAGTLYFAEEVSDLMVFQQEGFTYIKNTSITFVGVKFQTLCSVTDSVCPTGTVTTTSNSSALGAFIRFRMTFPGGAQEIATESIGGLNYAPATSAHTDPSAGILVEYLNKSHSYKAFLLVTPYSTPGA